MVLEVTADVGEKDETPESDTIKLVGEEYEFYFPKVGAVLSKMRRAGQEAKSDDEKGDRYYHIQTDWLERGFGEDAWGEITDRLEDEDDDLDTKHLTEAFRMLFKAAAGGRPTTSPSGSSRSRSASKRKAAPSRKDSDSETSTSENSAA